MTILPSLVRLGRGEFPAWLPLVGDPPKLYADFINARYWANGVQQVDFAAWLAAASLSFARSSTAYYVNASGALTSAASNVARFDHDVDTLAATGLLVEGARTNVIPNSQGFVNAGLNSYLCYFPFTLTNGVTYSVSVWAKRISATAVNLKGYTWTGSSVDLSTQSAAVPTSWTRLTGITVTGHGADGGFVFPNNSAITTFTTITDATCPVPGATVKRVVQADGTEIYVAGPQFEAGVPASSYVPSSGSAATRAADSLTASWSAVSAGTLYARADAMSVSAAQRLVQIDDGSPNNRASLSFNASAAGAFDVLNGGSSQAALGAGTITVNTKTKLAAAFAANDFSLVTAGGAPATDTSGSVPTFSALRFGADSAGANNLFGHLAEIAVWNGVRASDADLQRLTT